MGMSDHKYLCETAGYLIQGKADMMAQARIVHVYGQMKGFQGAL